MGAQRCSPRLTSADKPLADTPASTDGGQHHTHWCRCAQAHTHPQRLPHKDGQCSSNQGHEDQSWSLGILHFWQTFTPCLLHRAQQHTHHHTTRHTLGGEGRGGALAGRDHLVGSLYLDPYMAMHPYMVCPHLALHHKPSKVMHEVPSSPLCLLGASPPPTGGAWLGPAHWR